MLRQTDAGGTTIEYFGDWKPHIGGGTPRDFGPCGDVLDCNRPLLFKHIERRYTYFDPVKPAVEEALLVPFHIEGKALGTVWAVTHDGRHRFDAEDERQLETLARFASAAYQTATSVDAFKQLAAIVESSDDAIISKKSRRRHQQLESQRGADIWVYRGRSRGQEHHADHSS